MPGGELEYDWLAQALDDLDIPQHRRPLYRRLVSAVHSEVREHGRRQQSQSSD
ncbi:MAG: hypothetical protein ACYCYR_09625 [Desulfobulbaceae bacterium]